MLKRRSVLALLVGLVGSVLVGTAGPAVAGSPAVPAGCSSNGLVVTQTTPVGIPDYDLVNTLPGVAVTTVEVSGLDPHLWDVDLTTQILHSFSSDLKITLTSPAATEVVISQFNGGNWDDVFSDTTWDDSANAPVSEYSFTTNGAVPPLTPEGAMGAFVGEDPNGTWTLRVEDHADADVGTIVQWGLSLQSLTSAPHTTTMFDDSLVTPTAIPDPGVLEVDIEVDASPGPLSQVWVNVFHTHTDTSDLVIDLTSPAGTNVLLSSFNGGLGGTFIDMGTPVTEGGTTPEGAMGTFVGEDPTGTWTLQFEDFNGGDAGTLNYIGLRTSYQTCEEVIPVASGQTLYGLANDLGGLSSLYTINPMTGAATLVGATGLGAMSAMDMDPTTGQLYGVLTPSNELVSLAKATGVAAVVGSTGLSDMFASDIRSLTIDLSGIAYATWSGDNKVYRVNLATGVATGLSPGTATYAQSAIGHDPATGTLWVRQSGDGPNYETINPATGAATVVNEAWQPDKTFFDGALEFDRNGQSYAIGGATFDPETTNWLITAAVPSPATWVIGNTGLEAGFGNGLTALAFDVGPPVAVPDAYSVGESSTLTVNGVLDNDIDPDSDLTATVTTPPVHGALALNPDGTFTYTPRPNYVGPDSFVYLASDGVSSSQATATITVAPLAPTVGLVDVTQGKWYLRNSAGAFTSFFYGNPGDLPISGDWDGDGDDTPGLYRQSDGFFYARNSNSQGAADAECFAGDPSDVPVVGDWDGDGDDNLGIYRPSEQKFYLFTTTCTGSPMGAAQIVLAFGNPGDKPTSGDWDGDGITEIGLHRESTGFFYWRNTLTTGPGDGEIFFGDPNDRFVTGDWGLVDNIDSPAIYRPGNLTFFFRHSLTQGNADSQFAFTGAAASWLPVAGKFGLG